MVSLINVLPRGGYGKLVQRELEAQRQLVDYGGGSLGSFPPVMPPQCKLFKATHVYRFLAFKLSMVDSLAFFCLTFQAGLFTYLFSILLRTLASDLDLNHKHQETTKKQWKLDLFAKIYKHPNHLKAPSKQSNLQTKRGPFPVSSRHKPHP